LPSTFLLYLLLSAATSPPENSRDQLRGSFACNGLRVTGCLRDGPAAGRLVTTGGSCALFAACSMTPYEERPAAERCGAVIARLATLPQVRHSVSLGTSVIE